MALVVVLRDYEIKFPLERAIEHCVAGDGPLDVDAFLLGDLDRRLDALDFLPAENAPFATVRIQAGDGDARFGDAEFTKVLVSRADRGNDSFDGMTLGGVVQALVRGYMNRIELVARKQHEGRFCPGEVGEQFGMPVE